MPQIGQKDGGSDAPAGYQSRAQVDQWSLIIREVRRIQDLNAGIVLAVERCHCVGAAVVRCVLRRVEPKPQMVGLHGVGFRIFRCIRERWIIEDLRCRRDVGSNDKRLNAKPPPKVLDRVAISVRLHIPLIPGQPKRGLGNLDHKEVESGMLT